MARKSEKDRISRVTDRHGAPAVKNVKKDYANNAGNSPILSYSIRTVGTGKKRSYRVVVQYGRNQGSKPGSRNYVRSPKVQYTFTEKSTGSRAFIEELVYKLEDGEYAARHILRLGASSKAGHALKRMSRK